MTGERRDPAESFHVGFAAALNPTGRGWSALLEGLAERSPEVIKYHTPEFSQQEILMHAFPYEPHPEESASLPAELRSRTVTPSGREYALGVVAGLEYGSALSSRIMRDIPDTGIPKTPDHVVPEALWTNDQWWREPNT